MHTVVNTLGAKRIGIVLLDRHRRIVVANDHAQLLLHSGIEISVIEGELVSHRESDNYMLNQLLAAALSNSMEDVLEGVMVVRRPDGSPVTIYVSPFSADDILNLGILSKIAVIVMMMDPQDKPQIDKSRLADALSLTPAQAHVAAELASGEMVQSIAASTYRSLAVVRWHIKQMMTQLDVTSQTDLVRLVITTPSVLDN